MLAFSAACGGAVAWLVTLTNAVGEAAADTHIAQVDRGVVDHRAGGVDDVGPGSGCHRHAVVGWSPHRACPSRCSTPSTAPALTKLTAMAPLTLPAALVLTLTVIPLLLVAPASRPLMLPLPLINAGAGARGRPEAGVQVLDEAAGPLALLVDAQHLADALADLHGAEVQRRGVDQAAGELGTRCLTTLTCLGASADAGRAHGTRCRCSGRSSRSRCRCATPAVVSTPTLQRRCSAVPAATPRSQTP